MGGVMPALDGLAAAYFGSGRAADAILVVLALECVWLWRWRRWPVAGAVAAVLPGVMFVLGLRAALVGAQWQMIALPLAGALPAHLWDLARRERRRRGLRSG